MRAFGRQHWRWLSRSSRVLFSPWLALLPGLLAGALLAFLLRSAGPGAGIAAIGLGLFAVALPLIVAQRLARRVIDEMHRTANMRPLLGDALLGVGWSADAALAYDVVALVDRMRPGLVFECGSGQSTVLVAERLRRIGAGRIVSVEHDVAFAAETRTRVAAAGLERFATVVHSPLVERAVDGVPRTWYAPTYEEHLAAPIDLLIVDGPPGNVGPEARYPAVPLLRSHLAESCTVVLDDGDRKAERTIASRWALELPAQLQYSPSGKGRWLLWRGRPRL